MITSTPQTGRLNAEQMLCEALVDVGGFAGAGAALLWPARGARFELAATDKTFQMLAETQFTLWEGSGPEAFTSGRTVVSNDPVAESHRWPLLTAQLAENHSPVRSHAAAPLTRGGTVFGLLGIYRLDDRAITTAEESLLDAFSVAIAATALQRAGQHEDSDRAVTTWLPEAQTAIAVGMVISYLNVSGLEATALLRAHAFVTGTTLLDLAAALIEHRVPLSVLDGAS